MHIRYISGSQIMFPGPAALAAPWNFLMMQYLDPKPIILNLKLDGGLKNQMILMKFENTDLS